MYETRQQKALTSRTLPLVDGRHKQYRLSICEVIQTRKQLDPQGHIVLDTNTNEDKDKILNVHYSQNNISCKKYTDRTKKIVSQGFSGCLMAIFHCKHHIGEIKGGVDDVEHVANDLACKYRKENDIKSIVEINGNGSDLLKDLVEFRYIKKLKYFRPYTKNKDEEQYKRNVDYKLLLKLNGATSVGIDSETGIIKFDNSSNPKAYHKFERDTSLGKNTKIGITLNTFNSRIEQYTYSNNLDIIYNYALWNAPNIVVVDLREVIFRNKTDFCEPTLDFIANNEFNMDESVYNNMSSTTRQYYRNRLSSNSALKVPQWLKNRHNIIYKYREVIVT